MLQDHMRAKCACWFHRSEERGALMLCVACFSQDSGKLSITYLLRHFECDHTASRSSEQ